MALTAARPVKLTTRSVNLTARHFDAVNSTAGTLPTESVLLGAMAGSLAGKRFAQTLGSTRRCGGGDVKHTQVAAPVCVTCLTLFPVPTSSARAPTRYNGAGQALKYNALDVRRVPETHAARMSAKHQHATRRPRSQDAEDEAPPAQVPRC